MKFTAPIISILLVLLPSFLSAKTEISFSSQYYSFQAHDKASIWKGIAAKSPKVSQKDHVRHQVIVGLTEWDLRQHYRFRGSLNRCELVGATTQLNVSIHLPYWEDKWKAPGYLQKSWDQYVRMVSDHEGIHKAYAIRTAERIDKEVSELVHEKDCEQLKAYIDEIVQKHMQQNRLDNRWFDAKEKIYQKHAAWF
ncbi:hypothetical protein A9Q99_02125 [Gammaproteobacteria bacterium 45_16_T64]|nr:hypothetical protein A9Q99_02125 [Gammaproteobacteria bacterium 45_16_T64]